jgi:predicted aconitase
MAHSLRDQKALALAESLVEAVKPRHGRDGKDGAIVVRTDETALQALERRITALEELPPKPDNDASTIPVAIGKLVERLEVLESRPEPLLPSVIDNDQLQSLGQDLAEMSAAMLLHVQVLQERVAACEARFDELPQVLEQLQAERRRA